MNTLPCGIFTPSFVRRATCGAALLALAVSFPALSRGQNLYVSNSGSPNAVLEFAPGVGLTGFISGFNDPTGLAFDSSGNLYVANAGTNQILKVTSGGVVSTFASLSQGTLGGGLAVSSGGNVYASNTGLPNAILEFGPGGGFLGSTSGFNDPNGLAFDTNGNLFVANEGTNQILEVSTGGVVTQFASLSEGTLGGGLAFNSSGDLFVSNTGLPLANDAILEFGPGGGLLTTILGFDDPNGMAFNSSGNLFVANVGTNQILKVTSGGVVSPFASLSQGNLGGGVAYDAAAIPEPADATAALGLAALAAGWWRRRRQA